MSKSQKVYGLPLRCFEVFSTSLADESDRAQVILAASWIDMFLKAKLMNHFSKGNARARKEIFTGNGPFATFSAKLNATFCAGWIDRDVYHDVQIIRKLRNTFAHSIEPVSLNDKEVRTLLESLRVPHRQYDDWGQLRAASTDNGGVLLYTGEKPPEAIEELHTGAITFRMALPLIVAVLVANLSIPFTTDEEGTITTITLPGHMKTNQQED